MPKTKLQDVIFTIMMVIVMVYAMVVYNISIDKGGVTNEVFVLALGELLLMGIVGFVLEMLIAGPLAKKLAFRIVSPREDKMIFVILAISSMTVCLMCPLMSFVATALFKGFQEQFVANWIQTTVMNFPMALCWQIFFAGPLVRLIFGKMFPEKRTV
ncbi:DUF2798 domain-containing protein [Anaerosporobacter sp.]|uniref:DUF2798 domain-containing protein n=1 Tax=Anaerosporobacter sp. TaxID=1872529 RepID=UPI00286FAD77|nr:DUF2798 domain-containing protein [Anaerosporobacter sp.]